MIQAFICKKTYMGNMSKNLPHPYLLCIAKSYDYGKDNGSIHDSRFNCCTI